MKTTSLWTRTLLSMALFASVLFISQAAVAQPQDDDQDGTARFVYTESNSTGANYVLGFKAASDGKLTPLPGSPFPTGGQGDGVRPPLGDSDHGMAVAYSRLLLASNRGSNSISVFRINEDGSLSSVEGSPFEAGVTPVSITIHGDLVFVLDFGTGAPNNCFDCAYRGFRLEDSGKLTPIPGAVYHLTESPSPVPFSLTFSPDGNFLIGTELATSRINVLKVQRGDDPWDVQIFPVSGSPFASQGNQPFGAIFSPVHPDQLFVSTLETPAFPPDKAGDVSSYRFSGDGSITAITPAPVSTGGQRATCWVTMTHDGKFLFAANTASGTLSSFRVSEDGQMSLVGVYPIPHGTLPPGLTGPVDMAVTSDDQFLYVPTLVVASVSGFRIQADGQLTPVEDPLAVTIPNSIPFGMAIVDMK